MNKIIKKSPAKINIGLNVKGKRPDGFHNIETVFYPLLLTDELIIERAYSISINSNSEQLNKIKKNILEKTIKVIESKIKEKIGIKIFVDKKIPLGAGLGGGSSNAGNALKALNELYELKMSYETLLDLALKIGSDVPFFLNPLPTFAESRGEIFKPISFEINYPILIVNPGINISTKWAFNNITFRKPAKNLFDVFAKGSLDFEELKNTVYNDFQLLLFSKYPEIKEIKDELYNHGAEFALMTGTGSTVFGIFSNLQRAYLTEDFFKQKNYFTYLNNPFQTGSIT
jgi:4-diphosphocytidyl-2-C-methyl-D-erythritol kinase